MALFVADGRQIHDGIADGEYMMSDELFLDGVANALKGQEEIGVFMLVEDGIVGDQFKDLISELFRRLGNIVPIKNILASQLVPHVRHEFKDLVIAFQDALELLKEHRERQDLAGGPPEGE